MTTTPQTLTLAGDDYVVIPRDEYERPRAAADPPRQRPPSPSCDRPRGRTARPRCSGTDARSHRRRPSPPTATSEPLPRDSWPARRWLGRPRVLQRASVAIT